MRRMFLSLAIASLAFTLPAHAADPMALASKYGCVACHAVDHAVVGPAWKDVAKKYHGQPGAEDHLIQKVRNGGSGVWGSVAMPPNQGPTDAELKELVQFILALK